MILRPEQYKRFVAFQKSDKWTRFIRHGYPPCARSRTAVAWDSLSQVWALCYEKEGIVPGQAKRPYLKPFYFWRDGMGAAMPPGPLMVEWLREHDMYSGEHVGVWSDEKFKARARSLSNEEDKSTEDLAYLLRHERRPEIRVAGTG